MRTFATSVGRFAAAKKIAGNSSRRKLPAPKHAFGGDPASWDVNKTEMISAGPIEMGPTGMAKVNVGSSVRATV